MSGRTTRIAVGLVGEFLLVEVDGAEQFVQAVDDDEGDNAAVGGGRRSQSVLVGREAKAESMLHGDRCGFKGAEGGSLVSVTQRGMVEVSQIGHVGASMHRGDSIVVAADAAGALELGDGAAEPVVVDAQCGT